MQNVKYTIIVPCCNEEENIEKVYEVIKRVMDPLFLYEFLFVDDGSTDNTLERIKSLRLKDKRIKYISFLTNYGHQKAIFAGLHICNSDFAITIDGDLQHPPEYIPELIRKQQTANTQIVAARRKGVQQGLFKNFFSKLFYRLFKWMTGISLHSEISDFRLYSREAINILCSIKEQEPFLRGMISDLKLKIATIDYDLNERQSGQPSYTFRKSLSMGLTALFRFSDFPIKIGFIVGFCGILLSIGMAIHYLYLRLFTNELIPGQADLMVFISLISSIIVFLLSLLLRTNRQILDAQRCQPSFIITEKKTDD